MSLRVVFRQAAKDDLDEAAGWYEDRRAGLGEEFLSEVGAAIERAADHPERYPVVSRDVRRAVLRRFPYAVYFRPRQGWLVVLAVFHGRRDPLIWTRRT